MAKLLPIALALCLISAGLPSHRLYLSGSVHFKKQRGEANVEGLSLFVKAAENVVASTKVDGNGRYDISFIPEDQPSFDFYYAGLGHDTTFIKSFTKFESDVMTWDIEL